MEEYYLIAGMALVTFVIRYTPFVVAGRMEFPAWLISALRYVPPAVLTAIIVPAVLFPSGGRMALSYTNPYLVAAVLSVAIAWFSRNLLLTIVLGMAIFLGWQWLLAAWL